MHFFSRNVRRICLANAFRPSRWNSKIVLLFNDEHEHNRWNDTLGSILSQDRLFARGAWLFSPFSAIHSAATHNNEAAVAGSESNDEAMDAAAIESDSKAWQEWQQVVC